MELRIVDKPKRFLLARFDGGNPMIIGEGYLMDMGAFSDGGRVQGPPGFRLPYTSNEYASFEAACAASGLEEHSMRRLWGALVEAYFVSGSEKDDEARAKTLNKIRAMWEDPVKNWWPDGSSNSRLVWAGLAPVKPESKWL